MGKDDNGSAVYNIVALNFAGEDTAKQNLKTMKDNKVFDGYKIEAECIVSQNDKGKVHIHEPGHGAWGAAAGAAVGGLLGMLGGPAGAAALGAAGAAIGGAAGHIGDALFPRMIWKSLARKWCPIPRRCC